MLGWSPTESLQSRLQVEQGARIFIYLGRTKQWLDEHKVAAITGRAVGSLRNDRWKGKGFPYYRLGTSIRYKLGEILKLMEQFRVDPRR